MRLLLLALCIAGCAKKIKHTEYLIDGEWRRCDFIATEACGEKFRCDEILYSCQTNVQTRAK